MEEIKENGIDVRKAAEADVEVEGADGEIAEIGNGNKEVIEIRRGNKGIAEAEKGEASEKSLDNGEANVDETGSLEAEIVRLKEEGQRQKSEFEAAIKELKIKSAALERLYSEGAKNPKLMLKLIDISKADFGENGSLVGLDEQIDNLKNSEGYLFDGYRAAMGCFRPEESGDFSETHKTDFSLMTYSQMLRALGE